MNKIDEHYIVSAIKEHHRELGRPPTMKEFKDRFPEISYWILRKTGWTNYLNMAGLTPVVNQNDKAITDQIFEASIFQQIENFQPREFKSPEIDKKILVIGDTHFPFVHNKCLEALYKFSQLEKPDYIVQVGDLLDLYSHSKFPRSQNVYSPKDEEALAIDGARNMWKILKKDSPKAQCFQLLGNHDVRPVKRTAEVLPSMEHVVQWYFKELMTFDGVTTIQDYRQELEIMGILFHHGYRSRLGAHRDYTLQNMVCGHSHKGGVVYRRIKDETIWELNAGFVGDAESKAFSYHSQKIHDCTLGWGWIDPYGPRFIHF